MTIDQTLPIRNMTSLHDVQGLSDKAQADGEKIKEFAQDFESVFISNLLEQMSASVDSLNEEKDGAAKQIDGIFRMQLAQNLSEHGSLGLAKSIEQYVSHTLNPTQVSEGIKDSIL
jgi:Rod binding domain-containing protein